METSRFPFQNFKTTIPGKLVATDFWVIHGVILVDFTLRGATINIGRYLGTLTGLWKSVRRNSPELPSQGVLLLHDNANHTLLAPQ
jgi:hypothetical protein